MCCCEHDPPSLRCHRCNSGYHGDCTSKIWLKGKNEMSLTRKVVYMDENGEMVTEEITEEEFERRFEQARENYRKKFIEGIDENEAV